MGLESLVSKHRDRPYRAGRSPHWVNRKHPASARQEARTSAIGTSFTSTSRIVFVSRCRLPLTVQLHLVARGRIRPK